MRQREAQTFAELDARLPTEHTASAGNVGTTARGVIDGKRQSYTIGANDQLFSSEQYKPIVIAYHNGAPVRLTDVAERLSDLVGIFKLGDS